MGQIYLIEFFLNDVKMFGKKKDQKRDLSAKKFVVTIKFGPKMEFVIKESLLDAVSPETWTKDKYTGRKMWVRRLNAGKAILFPSYTDTVMQIVDKFPLEVAVWNEDESEADSKILVGVGTSHWSYKFFEFLRQSLVKGTAISPLIHKQDIVLMDDCCCTSIGYVQIVIRMSVMANFIVTTFQQKSESDNSFVFGTNMSDDMFESKKIAGDDPNFCMVGPLYEPTTILEALKKNKNTHNTEDEGICTADNPCSLQNTRMKGMEMTCGSHKIENNSKITIKMGDIRGPCGNKDCAIAQKIKFFLRNLKGYKVQADHTELSGKKRGRKICGVCVCSSNKWHREGCPIGAQKLEIENINCPGCGKLASTAHACNGIDLGVREDEDTIQFLKRTVLGTVADDEEYTGCTETAPDDNCLCVPPSYQNPCNIASCDCIEERIKRESRKKHKPFCPAYGHKKCCPVAHIDDEEPELEERPSAKDVDVGKSSPLVLPPLILGPCPVTGRPCTTGQQFYQPKTDLKETDASRGTTAPKPKRQPPVRSYSDAGKICCKAEMDRVKKFFEDFLREEPPPNNYRCINAMTKAATEKCCANFTSQNQKPCLIQEPKN